MSWFSGKYAACLLLTITVTVFNNVAPAQDGPLDRVQAVVDGLRSPEQAYDASQTVLAHPGVVACRVDHNTRNLMLQVDHGCALNADILDQWLTGSDLHIRCYQRVPNASGPFHHLDPRHCGLDPEDK